MLIGNRQRPPPHTRAAGQAFEQRPQCCSLVRVSVSHGLAGSPSQSAKPLVQSALHRPSWHHERSALLLEHTRPHCPQLLGSVATATHCAPHNTAPPKHRSSQLPIAQICDAVHVAAHTPQCAESVCRSTQRPAHSTEPPPHRSPASGSGGSTQKRPGVHAPRRLKVLQSRSDRHSGEHSPSCVQIRPAPHSESIEHSLGERRNTHTDLLGSVDGTQKPISGQSRSERHCSRQNDPAQISCPSHSSLNRHCCSTRAFGQPASVAARSSHNPVRRTLDAE